MNGSIESKPIIKLNLKKVMKNLLKLLAVTLTIITVSFSSQAESLYPLDDYSRIIVTTDDAAVMTLHLLNLDGEATEIKIKDTNGDLLYFKKIAGNEEYAYRINLAQLTDGDYQLFVNREQKRFVQSFMIQEGNIIASQLKEIIKPIFEVNDAYFTITQRGLIVENISVTDVKGNVVYSKNFDSEDIEEVSILEFNTEALSNGVYTVRVQTSEEYYFNDLTIK